MLFFISNLVFRNHYKRQVHDKDETLINRKTFSVEFVHEGTKSLKLNFHQVQRPNLQEFCKVLKHRKITRDGKCKCFLPNVRCLRETGRLVGFTVCGEKVLLSGKVFVFFMFTHFSGHKNLEGHKKFFGSIAPDFFLWLEFGVGSWTVFMFLKM